MAKVGDHVLGVKAESVYGTAVAPDTRFEVISEKLVKKQDYIESKSLKAGRRFLSTNGHVVGKSSVEGDVEMEIPSAGAGFWFKQLLGYVATTTPSGATNRRLHTFTSASIDSLSFTTEIQRTDVAGTAHRFVYAGCALTDLEFDCKVGELATMKAGIFGQSETVSAASAQSATYPTSTPLVFTGASLSVNGTAVPVKEFNCKIENGRKTDRYFLGSSQPSAPIEADLRSCEGKFTVEWTGLTQYNYFLNHNTDKALVAKFETQSAIEGSVKGYVQITIPAIAYTGETPTGGGDVIEQSIDFKALDDGTNEPVKIEYLSLDASF